MSDTHEVNEIGKWYDIPIIRTRMNEYMTKWMLTGMYDVDNSEYDEHIYFNYALNEHFIDVDLGMWGLELAPKGREYLNKGETNE